MVDFGCRPNLLFVLRYWDRDMPWKLAGLLGQVSQSQSIAQGKRRGTHPNDGS